MRSRSCAFWPSRAGAAELEQALLARHQRAATSGSPSSRARSSAGKAIVVRAVALGLEAGLARRELVERLGDDARLARVCVSSSRTTHVARLDPVAVA